MVGHSFIKVRLDLKRVTCSPEVLIHIGGVVGYATPPPNLLLMNKPLTAREAKLKGELSDDYIIDWEKGLTVGQIEAAKAGIKEKEAAETRVGTHTLFEIFDSLDGSIKCVLPCGDEVALEDILLLFKHANHDLLTEVSLKLVDYGVELVNSASGETIFGFSFEMF